VKPTFCRLLIINSNDLSAVKITDGDPLQKFVSDVNSEWNNLDDTEWNNDDNVNEVRCFDSVPLTENYWENLHFSSLNSDGTKVEKIDRNVTTARSSSDGSFRNIVQDALYEFDFNEADVESLLN